MKNGLTHTHTDSNFLQLLDAIKLQEKKGRGDVELYHLILS